MTPFGCISGRLCACVRSKRHLLPAMRLNAGNLTSTTWQLAKTFLRFDHLSHDWTQCINTSVAHLRTILLRYRFIAHTFSSILCVAWCKWRNVVCQCGIVKKGPRTELKVLCGKVKQKWCDTIHRVPTVHNFSTPITIRNFTHTEVAHKWATTLRAL